MIFPATKFALLWNSQCYIWPEGKSVNPLIFHVKISRSHELSIALPLISHEQFPQKISLFSAINYTIFSWSNPQFLQPSRSPSRSDHFAAVAKTCSVHLDVEELLPDKGMGRRGFHPQKLGDLTDKNGNFTRKNRKVTNTKCDRTSKKGDLKQHTW